jgi:hypothetical protein
MKTGDALTWDQAINLTSELSRADKAALIAVLASELGKEEAPPAQRPKSFFGVMSYLGGTPTDEDIEEARREMWGNFPREDIV